MAFEQKEWLDRVSEYPMRRQLTDEDGNIELVTLERADGEVSTEGDAFSASNMNDLEQRVADGFGSAQEAVDALKKTEDDKLNNLFQYNSSSGRLVINLDAL